MGVQLSAFCCESDYKLSCKSGAARGMADSCLGTLFLPCTAFTQDVQCNHSRVQLDGWHALVWAHCFFLVQLLSKTFSATIRCLQRAWSTKRIRTAAVVAKLAISLRHPSA